MRLQKCFRHRKIAFAHFPQHPAHRFLDQVFRVGPQETGNFKGLIEIALFDKGKSGQNGNAPPRTTPRAVHPHAAGRT